MVLGSASFSVRHYRQSGRGQTKRRREFQCYPSPMPSADAHRYLTLQFLAWAAERPRTRADVLEAWHSCPRSSIWEDCVVEGLVRLEHGGAVCLTERGRAVLNGGGPEGVRSES